MNKLFRVLLSGSAIAFVVQTYAQTASMPITEVRSRDLNVRDAQVVDSYVPVVTMEQFHSPKTRLQGYRVQLFKDGHVIYHGLKNTRTLGEVRFDLQPEQIQKILADFDNLKFWNIPEDQYGTPRGFAPLVRTFTLRKDSVSKTVRLSAQSHGAMLQKVIEDEVQSRRWRCPYVDELSIELCASNERSQADAIPDFLKSDLPRLLEIYR